MTKLLLLACALSVAHGHGGHGGHAHGHEEHGHGHDDHAHGHDDHAHGHHDGCAIDCFAAMDFHSGDSHS